MVLVIKGDENESLGNRIGEQQATQCMPADRQDRARWPMANGLCSLCRVNFATSYHHLIPKAVVRRHMVQIVITRQGVGQNLIPLCRPCHIFIHKAFTHKQLALEFNTRDKLREHPLVSQFTEFITRRGVGKKIRGKRIIIEGEMVSIKGCLPITSYNTSADFYQALSVIDEFFRTRNWNR